MFKKIKLIKKIKSKILHKKMISLVLRYLIFKHNNKIVFKRINQIILLIDYLKI